VALGTDGRPQTIDVAFKRSHDANADLYNTENRSAKFDGWRVPGREIPPGTHSVKVTIRAHRFVRDFWFVLKNPGGGGDIEFRVA
jgi:hypothetical protein